MRIANCTQAFEWHTIFNDLERPLIQISRLCHYLTLNISEMVQDTDSYNVILIETTLLKVVSLVTLSDLELISEIFNDNEALCGFSAAAKLLVLFSVLAHQMFIFVNNNLKQALCFILFTHSRLVRCCSKSDCCNGTLTNVLFTLLLLQRTFQRQVILDY